jgi:predicted transcriptional regulator
MVDIAENKILDEFLGDIKIETLKRGALEIVCLRKKRNFFDVRSARCPGVVDSREVFFCDFI